MATERSRTFDLQHGAVYVQVQDLYGSVSNHTVYVATVPDVNAAIAQMLLDVDTAAEAIHAKMVAAGYVAS